MRSEQKAILGETGRWLRIGTLTLATLAPLLSTFASRLPKRSAVVIDEDDVQAVRSDLDAQIEAELEKRRTQQLQQKPRQYKMQQAATASQERLHDLAVASQEKLQNVGTAFAGGIDDLKSHPYTRRLRQRGSDLTDTLREHASNFTHDLAERGDDFSQVLADRSDDLSHELNKRKKHMKRSIQKQNRKLQKRWQRQFQLQQQRANRSFWIALGFGFGLTIAGVITYQILRHRLQVQREEEQIAQLAYTDTNITAPSNGNVADVATKSSPSYSTVQTTSTSGGQRSATSTRTSGTQNANVTPLDAAFVGVTSTKLYYPIETPLDQLPTSGSNPIDVIYFLSVQEAKDQGFKPASSHSPATSSRADRSF